MTAALLLRDLADVGIRVSSRGDKLCISAAPGKLTEALKARLLREKPALLAELRRQNERPVVRFRLDPKAGWASAIGVAGETTESLIADLRERWPQVEVAQPQPNGEST